MSTYTITAHQTIRPYLGTEMKMICVDILMDTGKFRPPALPWVASISDGTTEAEAFMHDLSPDSKQLTCFFTTDAFSAMAGNVTVSFGTYANLQVEENVALLGSIAALPSPLDIWVVPDADNAWLATI